jgi:hypothetical protein
VLTSEYADERRYMAIGQISEVHWTAILTERRDCTRIISVCRSRSEGTALYEQHNCMSETSRHNLEERFEAGESVIDYYETDVIITPDRLADLASILNRSAVPREAGMKVQTLRSKIRRRTPLTGEKTRRIVWVLKRHRDAQNLTQEQLAKMLGSCQSRVAKMEAADSSVSMELLARSLLILGATREEVGRVIAHDSTVPAAYVSSILLG